jgi:universal stress protein E
MTQITNFFVVYDPDRKEQPALQRAANIAEKISAKLHIFACIYSDIDKSDDKSSAINTLLKQQQCVLDEAAAALSLRGITVTTELEWDQDWHQAVVRSSTKYAPDLLLKSSYKHSIGRRMFHRTSDWTLIRECLCPVMLVKEGATAEIPKVLAAIDICAKNESYKRLNQNVIDFSRQIFCRSGTEVHFINAFQDFKGVPDRRQIMKDCGIESDKIHIKLGKPEKVIVDHAKKLDVSVVVVGNTARSGLSGALIGNTVEKVLDKVKCDVLSMP